MLLDGSLARSAIRTILEDRHRAVATSPGVDLAPVLNYALLGRRRHIVRDLIIAPIAVGALVAFFSLSLPDLLICLFLVWLVILVEVAGVYHLVIGPELGRGTFDPAISPVRGSSRVLTRLEDIAGRDHGNVTVFGEYKPFVGHGIVINAWSFVLNIGKAEEGEEVTSFGIGELYDHVGSAISGVGLPHMAVEDRIFVNGQDLRDHLDSSVGAFLLPDPTGPPRPEVSRKIITLLRDSPHDRARTYLTISLPGWDGEVVVSVFLRFALLPDSDLLFIEASYSLLTPLRERYREIDDLIGTAAPVRLLKLARQSIARVPGALVMALPHVLADLAAPFDRRQRDKASRKEIRNGTFNYGSKETLRESAADQRYHRYFQQLDKEMYVKLVERRIIDILVDFLSDHNVDVSDLVERRTAILNNGIFVTGKGQVSAQSLAAGIGAMAQAVTRVGQAKGGETT
ncbi:membrane protein [Sphaerisporangium rubeum]